MPDVKMAQIYMVIWTKMVMDISIQIKVYCLLGEIPNKTLSKYFLKYG